jgi:hypothetical protein
MNFRKTVGLASLDPPYSFIQIQELIGPGMGEDTARLRKLEKVS